MEIIFVQMNVVTQGVIRMENCTTDMTIFEKIPEQDKSDFMDMVDKIVMMSDFDPELKEGLRYLDDKAKLTETSIYEVIYAVLGKWELEKRVKKWREAKNDSFL